MAFSHTYQASKKTDFTVYLIIMVGLAKPRPNYAWTIIFSIASCLANYIA